mgnify:FL=1
MYRTLLATCGSANGDSFYITTCFFNTNLTNLSNIAERLVEKTIRFVLHTNLSELYECG